MSKDYDFTNPYEIAKFIKEVTKTTPVKAYIKGDLSGLSDQAFKIFGEGNMYVLFGEASDIMTFIEGHSAIIEDFEIENIGTTLIAAFLITVIDSILKWIF